jgi:hypothetical protein
MTASPCREIDAPTDCAGDLERRVRGRQSEMERLILSAWLC